MPRIEKQLFAGEWQRFVLALEKNGSFCGLVTAVVHQSSGWIGNLIVPPQMRGHGYGTRLFHAALETLQERNVDSVWLTASALGRPIYEKSGFVEIDSIERWSLKRKSLPAAGPVSSRTDMEAIREADKQAWKEDRTVLLNALAPISTVLRHEDSVVLVQQEQEMTIFGPWYSMSQCPRANRLLLLDALAIARPAVEIIADVFSSSFVKQLLSAVGFICVGTNLLMVRGEPDVIDHGTMISLASLGSIG